MMPDAPPTSDAPLDLLMACHERIRRYLGGVDALIAVNDPLDPRCPPTAAACARYFREGLPLHGQDEDLSLTPRLLAHGVDASVREALHQMREEHVAMDGGLPEVLALLDAAARGEAAALVEPQRWLSELLLSHIAAEEAAIFPAIALLPPDELAAITREIRARRRG